MKGAMASSSEASRARAPMSRSIQSAEKLVEAVIGSMSCGRIMLERLSHASLVRWRAEVYSDATLANHRRSILDCVNYYARTFDSYDARAVVDLSKRYVALIQQAQLPFFATAVPSLPNVLTRNGARVGVAELSGNSISGPPAWLSREMECASLVLMRAFYGRQDVSARRHELPSFAASGTRLGLSTVKARTS